MDVVHAVRAVAVLAPSSATGAGADEVVASAAIGASALSVTRGFQVTATNVTIDSFTPAVASLGAYGQTSLTLNLSGVSIGTARALNNGLPIFNGEFVA